MKIRTGFVSNSSSSSFLIYGFNLEDSELLEKLEELADKEDTDIGEELEKLLDKNVTVSYFGCGDSGYYIGKSWSDIDDNETGKEFKKKIENAIQEIFDELGVNKKNLKCHTYEDTYYC